MASKFNSPGWLKQTPPGRQPAWLSGQPAAPASVPGSNMQQPANQPARSVGTQAAVDASDQAVEDVTGIQNLNAVQQAQAQQPPAE
jgi:hypothetical protein